MDRHPKRHPSRAARAASCPGCNMSIGFEPAELAYHGPEVQDVMCGLCGTITGRDRLLAEAFDATG